MDMNKDSEVFFNSRTLPISNGREITIPEDYFYQIGFETEVECILQKDHLILRPIRETVGSDHFEDVFNELMKEPEEDTEALPFTSIGDIFGNKEE